MVRVLVCLLMFGLGTAALGGGTFGMLVSAGVSLAINQAWRKQTARERQEQLEREEEARARAIRRGFGL